MSNSPGVAFGLVQGIEGTVTCHAQWLLYLLTFGPAHRVSPPRLGIIVESFVWFCCFSVLQESFDNGIATFYEVSRTFWVVTTRR